jgi:hypothetical protein
MRRHAAKKLRHPYHIGAESGLRRPVLSPLQQDYVRIKAFDRAKMIPLQERTCVMLFVAASVRER